MECIHVHSSLLPLAPQLKHRHKLKTGKLKLFSPSSSQEPAYKFVHRSKKMATKTRAISESLILGAVSPAKGGDISVLIQTGGIMLFMYGIANFVVPYFISKDSTPEDDGNS